jgi:hypothetical protein
MLKHRVKKLFHFRDTLRALARLEERGDIGLKYS